MAIEKAETVMMPDEKPREIGRIYSRREYHDKENDGEGSESV
jgi:hypothetical protein